MSADWRDQGACVGEDPRLFFPDSTEPSVNRALRAEAVAICDECPVRAECREFAQTSNNGGKEQWGVWAGQDYGPKRILHESEIPAWRRPRTLSCEVCGTRWRWTPSAGCKAPKACSAWCRKRLISRAQVVAHKAKANA